MGAEIGATTSLFANGDKMAAYLKATGREDLADLAEQHKDELRADSEVYENPNEYFDLLKQIENQGAKDEKNQ